MKYSIGVIDADDDHGTTYITSVDATDEEAAKDAAMLECRDNWGEKPDNPYNLSILFVATGDITFLEWNDDN